MKPYQLIFFTLVAKCFKPNDEFMLPTASLHLNVKQCQEYMQEGERKLEATVSAHFHNTLRKKTAQIARLQTLTDSYTRFLLNAQPFLTFVTRTPKSILYIITLPKYTVLIHWGIVYANLLPC